MNRAANLFKAALLIISCINAIMLVLCLSRSQLCAGNIRSIDNAKGLLESQIIALSQRSSDDIEVSNKELEEILRSFSGLGFTFEELAYEFLSLSKRLKRKITFGDASLELNKYKKEKGLGLKYARFDSLVYDGLEDYMLMQFTPNTEDGQWHVELIDDRNVYYKKRTLFSVKEIFDKKVKVKKGVFSVDKAYINSGVSFKPLDGAERVDTQSILGILPRTELILIFEGSSNGKRLGKGSSVTVIDGKYGQVHASGDYIK